MPRPIDVPDGDFDVSADYSLCFAAPWLPAVATALSTLARPETYDTDDLAASFDAAQRGSQAQLSIKSGCGAPCPNWNWFEIATYVTPYDSTLNFTSGFTDCDCGEDDYRIRVGSIRYSTALNISRVAFEARRRDDHSNCGGHICNIAGIFAQVVVGNVWTFQWVNCLDEETIETTAGLLFNKVDFDCKRFCLTSTAPFSIIWTWDGEPLCGVA